MPYNDLPDYQDALTGALLPALTLAEAGRALGSSGTARPALRIIGRDPSPFPGRYLLERTLQVNGGVETWLRVLDYSEVLGYARGALCAAGLHDLIPTAVDPMPTMLSVDEAATAFHTEKINERTGKRHLTRDGIIARISNGRLEVIYLPRRERSIFEQEIATQRYGATREDMDAWQATRDRFGLAYRVEITDAHIPWSDKPLAVNPDKPHITNVVRAMMIAKAEGWMRYHTPDGDTRAEVVFHIPNIGGGPADVHIDHALPWLLGVADHFGPHAAELISYRPGLV
jgi:hypothetical protein